MGSRPGTMARITRACRIFPLILTPFLVSPPLSEFNPAAPHDDIHSGAASAARDDDRRAGDAPMKKRLSKAERARTNQNNSRKSTGPRTDAGKKSASMNSYKHGLCAKKMALPTEDATLLQEKLDHWVDHYQPETPGECELI